MENHSTFLNTEDDEVDFTKYVDHLSILTEICTSSNEDDRICNEETSIQPCVDTSAEEEDNDANDDDDDDDDRSLSFSSVSSSLDNLKNTSKEKETVDERNVKSSSWHRVTFVNGLMRIHTFDRVYPNFPHVYTTLKYKNEHLLDFIDITNETLKNGFFVDIYVILSCLENFCTSHVSDDSDVEFSETLAKALACILSGYSIDFNSEDFRSKKVPMNFLTRKWMIVYKYIRIKDFLKFVTPVMSNILSTSKNISFILASLTMHWFIREFKNVTMEIRSIIINDFKKFVSIPNYILALPFSFFVPIYTIRKYIPIENDSYRSTKEQEIAKWYILGYRNIYCPLNSTQKFQNLIPNYRYLDLRSNLLLSTYKFVNLQKNLPIDTISCLKTLGFAPFNTVSELKLSREARVAISLDIVRNQRTITDIRKNAREFFELKYDDFNYFTRITISHVTDYNKDDFVKSTSVKLKDYEKKIDTPKISSSICLNNEAITIFIPCLHKVYSTKNVFRIKNCPICRDAVFIRINNEKNYLYDELQLRVLEDTFSMFAKLIKQ